MRQERRCLVNCEKCGNPLGGGAIALTCASCSNLNRSRSTASDPARPRASTSYPHACAVLARESERLLYSMRVTLETPAEQMVRAANERYAALELAQAERALMYADDRLGALIELIAAAKANDSGGNDDRHVWMRRAVKTAEGLA